MSYNEKLEDRIDHYFITNENLTKNKRLGWVGWLVNRHMFAGIYDELLIVRLNSSVAETLIQKKGIELFPQNKQGPGTFLSLSKAIYQHPKALHKFLTSSYEFTSALPPNQQNNPPSIQSGE